MNASTHSEVALEVARGKEHFHIPSPDAVAEGASGNGPTPPPSTVRPSVLDHGTFETFIGGAGI
jgi:hypothetical protein